MAEAVLEVKQKNRSGSRLKKLWNKLTGRDGTTHSMDALLLLLVIVLVVFGLVMLFSASYAYAFYWTDDSLFYIRKQILFAALGFAFMLVASQFDYRHFRKFAWLIYVLSLGMLGAVFFFPEVNGAQRWVNFGILSFQPSEVAKFAVIVLFAALIHRYGELMQRIKYGLLPFILILLPVVTLVMLEPHLSGTLIICSIACIMMIVGGARLYWFPVIGVLGGGLIALFVWVFKIQYIISRIENWMNPDQDTLEKGYQVNQSLIAIGSGGLTGAGLGNSRQKYMYIPEPANDFVFSVICEELGFIGAVLIVILFSLLIWRGIIIAYRARETFGGMLALGITLQIGIQAMLNIMVVTGTVPNTGISLPFFSYGGTSLVMLLTEMGILLSVSRGSRIEKK